MKKLFGGFEDENNLCRIYDFNGEFICEDRRAPREIMESLAIYMKIPWSDYRVFRFFEPTKENEEHYCECVCGGLTKEAFVCGYGESKEAAFRDCIERLYSLLEEFE